jgi:ActR/RegA family two-component response regulator
MDSEEGRDLALKLGFQSYLIKPSDPNDIVTEIVNILTKKI